MSKKIYLLFLVSALCVQSFAQVNLPFRDTKLSIEVRVADLISRLTLDEKISLMTHDAAEIKRLDIPNYNWWNEGLHGVARSAPATVFPQAIGMAATFDPALIEKVASAISTEGRALYHQAISKGIHKQYLGLTYWSPNINVFRNPRWGRGQETYGEDPYLIGEIGAAFVRGIQGGKNTKYLKMAACAKHFAVHSGPEANRNSFNAEASQKDLNETYLPAFKRLVDEGVAGVMCAYNRINSEACCGSPDLLVDLIRNKWGFKGYIVSDCGALNDLHANHKVTKNEIESAALGVKSGVNVNCGEVYKHLSEAVNQGLINEPDIDNALGEQLAIRFRLGMFDKNQQSRFPGLTPDLIGSESNKNLARKVAEESIVLLKNKNNVLPLSKNIGHLFVSGNNAADLNALMGNYFGVSKNYVSILEGITNKVSNTSIVRYEKVILLEQDLNGLKIDQAVNAADADASIVVLGISGLYEGENGDTPFSKTGGDREKIELPENQMEYLRAVRKAGKNKPLIVVVCSGSALAIPELDSIADAVVWAWYPGEQGGNAVADVLFGDYNPSGKLPITIYKSTDQLADFEDYNISKSKQTYRYFEGEPLYPFGFGLSYTSFGYSDISLSKESIKHGASVEVKVTISNTGKYTGDEVVQLYLGAKNSSFSTPIASLKKFVRVTLKSAEKKEVKFLLTPEDLKIFDDFGEPYAKDIEFEINVGSSSPNNRAAALGAPRYVSKKLMVLQ